MSSSIPPDVLEAVRTALGAQYEIERVLGAGAMGSVLLAHDRTLERPVAIKVINPELAATSTFRQRFLQEARTVAKLRHGSIVAIHAAGDAAGVLYFVMEFVDGESLRDLLQREGALPVDRAAAITRELAGALGYAHRAGVIHRDIKPENILLDRETGHPRITDFGIARSLAAAGERMTGTGMSVGTPAYMSPEQATGERDIDGRSDLYSLGLVAYEMVAGDPAFTGESSASVIMKQIVESPTPLIERAADVPPAFAAVIEQALAKDPAERWPDGESMARAVEAAISGAEVPGLRAPAAAPARAHSGASQTADRGVSVRGRRLLPRTGRGWARLLVPLVAAAAALVWFTTRGPSGAASGVDPRRSFLVVPFRVQGGDPAMAWLRDGSVSMLALNLAQWRDISVVEHERSLDLLRDEELDGEANISLGQAQALARRAGVWTVVMGEVTRIADSLRVTASLFDVESGKRIRTESAEAQAPASADPRLLFDEVANELLGLVGVRGVDLQLAKTTTGSVDAYRHYLAGVRALNEWRLAAADSALARAVEVDSTFALAWYKRSLASGWQRVGDTSTVRYARQAMLFASRLPRRERALVEGNFEQQQQNWVAARQRYHDLLATDSTDAEAWYALGDAYYHDQTPGQRAANLTASLAAFKRTLALDSTFHLAYSHNLDLYNEASRDASQMVIVNDTVRLLTPAEVQRLGSARIAEARQRTRALAISNAERWVYTDEDAAAAYFALAEAYAAARDFVRARETLERAMARPSTRQSDFAYRIASYQLGAGAPDAVETLRRALREQTTDSLRLRSSARRFNILLGAANVALATGALEELDRVFARIAEVDPTVPGSERAPKPIRTMSMLSPVRAAIFTKLGLDARGAAAGIAASVKELDALPGRGGDQVRKQASQIAYAGFLLTRDTSYVSVIARWGGEQPSPAIMALAAIESGDTATARRIARQFRRGDTTGGVVPDHDPSGAFVEAEVLTRLGDFQGALATLSGVDPKRFNPLELDPRWALYVGALLDRGAVYERLGDPQRADSMYTRVLEVWKDADSKGEPVVEVARRRLADVRDAPDGAPIRR